MTVICCTPYPWGVLFSKISFTVGSTVAAVQYVRLWISMITYNWGATTQLHMHVGLGVSGWVKLKLQIKTAEFRMPLMYKV